jgi:hypothetical protein
MIELENFDLNLFQSSVVQEYAVLKKMKEALSQYSENPDARFHIDTDQQGYWSSLIWKGVFKVVGILEKNALQEYSGKPENIEYAKKSKYIVNHPKIKQLLCPSLEKEIHDDLLDEEKDIKTIKVVTSLIIKENIIKEFSIDLDAKLFAYMIDNILQKNIKSYCQE